MRMSDEVQRAVAENSPGLVATASKAGRPNVSAKASLRVLDGEHLVFADIRSPRTVANLKENPQVAIICLSPQSRHGCQIWGKAEITASGDMFEQFKREYGARSMMVNHVVKITVEDAVSF